MAFKDILVHVGGAALDTRLGLAAQLAETHGAHLIGLHVVAPPDIPPYIGAQLSAGVLEAQQRFAEEECARARAVFEDATAGRSFSAEWRDAYGDVLDHVQLHGRHADLVIAGQENDDDDNVHLDVAGRLVLSLGRPVLVNPYAGRFDAHPARVLVAWDGSRAAARALGDALPVLKRADAVAVLSINPETDHADMAGVDIAQHLARHDVMVDVRRVTSEDVDVGATVLSRAADFGADLIVMGAYGHARWRELVLGGVTEHVLAHMTAPVLMSH